MQSLLPRGMAYQMGEPSYFYLQFYASFEANTNLPIKLQ
jgi:hypothetical protein